MLIRPANERFLKCHHLRKSALAALGTFATCLFWVENPILGAKDIANVTSALHYEAKVKYSKCDFEVVEM